MKTIKSLTSILFISLTLAAVGCARGKAGPQGPAGTGGKIVATMNCGGTISGLVGAASALNGLYVEYNAVLTNSNDVYTTANVGDEISQVSGTAFYAAGQSGADDAAVYITADFHGTADAGLWTVSLDRNTLITSVEYEDPSLGAQSPVQLDFAASACSLQNW